MTIALISGGGALLLLAGYALKDVARGFRHVGRHR